jgi:hypothetical protein
MPWLSGCTHRLEWCDVLTAHIDEMPLSPHAHIRLRRHVGDVRETTGPMLWCRRCGALHFDGHWHIPEREALR